MIWKNIFKSWTGITVTILVVVSTVLLLPFFKQYVSDFWAAREAKKLADAYLNDSTGGQSPEETYDLFVLALRNEDIGLASKYFVSYKQDDWKETLEEYADEGLLSALADEFEKTKSEWRRSDNSTDSTISFIYDVTIEPNSTIVVEGKEVSIPAGTFQQESVFIKYPNNVWKIETL